MQSFINFILFTYFCSSIIFVFLCIYYCTCQITANPRENIGKINYCTNFQHSLVNSCEQNQSSYTVAAILKIGFKTSFAVQH